MTGIGIDPGQKNVGWSIFQDETVTTGTLVLQGGYLSRVRQMVAWSRANVPRASVVAVEKLSGGQNWMSQELAMVMAVVAVHMHSEAKLAIIHPSTHFFYVGGKGKRTLEFNERCSTIAGRTLNDHECTAVGCLVTALADLKGRLPEKIAGKIQWAT